MLGLTRTAGLNKAKSEKQSFVKREAEAAAQVVVVEFVYERQKKREGERRSGSG